MYDITIYYITKFKLFIPIYYKININHYILISVTNGSEFV